MFHKSLDKNGDGVIEMKEWIGQMRQYSIRGVEDGELNVIFDSMDVNQDGEISLNEMKLFLEGVKLEKDQFIKMLKEDREFMTECHDMINELFNEFDENKDQKVDAGEIMRTLRSFNIYKNEKECLEMIKTHSDGAPHVNKIQFNKMMMPIMIDELLAKKDNVQDLKRIFLEADVDNSGFLDVGELYGAIKRLGADITEDELAILMAEIDVDRNNLLDIDEFIQLMTMGDQINMG